MYKTTWTLAAEVFDRLQMRIDLRPLPGRWFKKQSYVLQPVWGPSATLGRNSIPDSGIFDWDFSVRKTSARVEKLGLVERH